MFVFCGYWLIVVVHWKLHLCFESTNVIDRSQLFSHKTKRRTLLSNLCHTFVLNKFIESDGLFYVMTYEAKTFLASINFPKSSQLPNSELLNAPSNCCCRCQYKYKFKAMDTDFPTLQNL